MPAMLVPKGSMDFVVINVEENGHILQQQEAGDSGETEYFCCSVLRTASEILQKIDDYFISF